MIKRKVVVELKSKFEFKLIMAFNLLKHHDPKLFTDMEFPSSINSLLEPDTKNAGIDKQTAEFYKMIVWKRASKIYS
jgi:hypothetical protein